MAKKRSIKVCSQSGYKYKETPVILLKGQWLKEAGFNIGDYISVTCEEGRLIISQDAEKAAMKAAEDKFMEEGIKDLRRRYEAEKEAIRAQCVAETGAGGDEYVYRRRITGNRPEILFRDRCRHLRRHPDLEKYGARLVHPQCRAY